MYGIHHITRTLGACFILCITGVVPLFASPGGSDDPAFGFPESIPVVVQAQVNQALKRTDCKFLGGDSFNTLTTLRYEGETVPLNLFLIDLAACPGITLSIRFYIQENAHYDWTVEQSCFQPDKLCVRINWKSQRINIEKLVLPDRRASPIVSTLK